MMIRIVMMMMFEVLDVGLEAEDNGSGKLVQYYRDLGFKIHFENGALKLLTPRKNHHIVNCFFCVLSYFRGLGVLKNNFREKTASNMELLLKMMHSASFYCITIENQLCYGFSEASISEHFFIFVLTLVTVQHFQR